MKLSLTKSTGILPISDKEQAFIIRNLLYTSYKNTIIVSDLTSLQILAKIDAERVDCFDVADGIICVCSTKIDLFCNNSYEKVATIETSGLQIINVKAVCIRNDWHIVCLSISGSITVFTTAKKYEICSSESPIDVFECSTRGSDIVVCFYSDARFYEYVGRRCTISTEVDDIVSIAIDEGCTYTVGMNGQIRKWDPELIEKVYDISFKNIVVAGDWLLCSCNRYLYVFDKDMNFIKRQVLLDEFNLSTIDESMKDGDNMSTKANEENSTEVDSSTEEIQNREKEATSGETEERDRATMFEAESNCSEIVSSSVSSDETNIPNQSLKTSRMTDNLRYLSTFNISFLSSKLVVTDEYEIFILNQDFSVTDIILGNNDEITDIKEDGDIVFIGTNSGRLRYTLKSFYNEGEYICKAYLVEGHTEAIMSISISNGFITTTSRDCMCITWRYDTKDEHIKKHKLTNSPLSIEKVAVLNFSGVPQTCSVMTSNLMFVGGVDGILKIYRNFRNIINVKIHSKEINCMDICEDRGLIVTGSQDKQACIVSFDGAVVHTLLGHTKGIMCAAFGAQYIATSSMDKTVRVYDIGTYECVSVLEGHSAYVSCIRFYRNDKYMASVATNGLIKIWDVRKKRCEVTISDISTTIWSFVVGDCFVFGSSGSLWLYSDTTLAKQETSRVEEERKQKLRVDIDKCMRTSDLRRLLGLAIESRDIQLMFATIESLFQVNDIEPLMAFKTHQRLFFEVLVRNSRFKNSHIVARLVMFASENGFLPSKDVSRRLMDICRTHCESIDLVYRNLVALNIFNRGTFEE